MQINKTIKIAIQGEKGAFHEIAAREYFNNQEIEVVACRTFANEIHAVETGIADRAIMAIENTVAGAILPNYGLIQKSNLEIVGEIYIRIVQNLIVQKGQSIDDIEEIHSHPMAIMQCNQFFKKYPSLRMVETYDTAGSVKEIKTKNLKNVGAIAGKLASELYDLEIIEPSIENNKKNYTRFFILGKKNIKNKYIAQNNKASLCFSLPHKPGSLSTVLSTFAYFEINLSKIQSHPILGKPWQYLFYVDLVFSELTNYNQAINAIKPFVKETQILGVYKKYSSKNKK